MGTHGAITKAGKVRDMTPKIDKMPKKKINPKRRYRILYKRRIKDNIPSGQFKHYKKKGD